MLPRVFPGVPFGAIQLADVCDGILIGIVAEGQAIDGLMQTGTGLCRCW